MFKKLLFLLPLLFLTACQPSGITELQPGHDTVQVFDAYEPAACIVVYDNGDEQDMDIISNNVDTDVVGTYLVQYEYEDFTCSRVVFVVDDVYPEVTLNPGVDTIHVGETWVDAGVTATDNYSETVTIEVVLPDDFDTTVVGTYTIQYIATDEVGNSYTASRIVHVIQ